MPGIRVVGAEAGFRAVPNVHAFLLANSMSGAGTPPTNALQAGDVVCLTQATALTASGASVIRMLLAADVTAVYKEGTPVAGVMGIAMDSASSSSAGVAIQPPALGGITTSAAIQYPYSYAGMQAPDDSTGRSRQRVALFTDGEVFGGNFYTGGGIITMGHQYDGTLAGFNLSTTAGITTFTIDVGATTKILRIIGPNTQDPLYNVAVANAATRGCEVFFEVLPAYQQWLTGVVYSTQ